MGLIPDISSIMSSLFTPSSTESNAQSNDISTLGSANTQGAYFRKNIEGFGKYDTDGIPGMSSNEINAMAAVGNANSGPISPTQWPVLKKFPTAARTGEPSLFC